MSRPGHARPAAPSRPGARSARRRPIAAARLLTPFRLAVVIALVGSLGYLAFAITVRDASQIPMLASGAAVLGLVFVAVALGSAVSAYRAGLQGSGGRALLMAAFGGGAAIAAAGCFAGAVVLALVWQP
jgi:hypothetical protein